MAIKLSKYDKVRDQMLPGDVIAFGGKGHFSEIIKRVTFSKVSHVAVVLQTQATYEAGPDRRFFNLIVESTKWDGFMGVDAIRLSDRLKSYDGQVWWLPLNRELRKTRRFDQKKFFDFLYAQKGRPYDLKQAVNSVLDDLDGLLGQMSPFLNCEDFSRFFCSELVAAGLEEAGLLDALNASEVTPADLCQWSIYEPDHHQLYIDKMPPPKERMEIPRYNRYDPALWSA
ncbi:MAG: hypothetical protein ACOZHQ_02645 [Thermodesulfobacteriota bacterium]